MLAALLVVAGLGGAALRAGAAGSPSGDWTSFGRTPDNMRHSPLTQIDKSNVDKLGRVVNLDLRKVDPSVRRGQQSFPLAIGGTLYLTTNNDYAMAVDGATGDIKWTYKPPNSGVFANFGVAVNRGLAYCDGKLFLTTLDMKIVSLRPSDGSVIKSIAINQFVPNASANYGYSQTSAPICAGGKLVMGAAGSEYGVRGYVMAYNTDLTPAWPNPYWTIPPDQQEWRRYSRIVGGGVVWTPVTIDAAHDAVYFGTGSGTPNFFHDLHPGANPRANSLVAVNLSNGKQRWWHQLVANDQWNYDVAQPPVVYDGKVGGKTRHVVSVATKEGVWFAFDAATGAPFHERVKVIDRVEHPPLRPGQPVTIFPSALGGVNYAPAAYDPATNYIFNAASETAAVLIEEKLTPTQKKHKLVEGDVFLGLSNGNFGGSLAGWHDHGSISAIDVSSGKRVWKFQTPEPERGGITTSASGLGFAGGGDGVLRAFDLKTGTVLWKFQTGAPIAAGPTLYTNGDKEYLAITVGGTPTSSNGGVQSQLQIFAIGGSQKESPPPSASTLAAYRADAAPPALALRPVRSASPRTLAATSNAATRAVGGGARIAVSSFIPVQTWTSANNNTQIVSGRLFLRGKPVVGATVAVDHYVLAARTSANGSFFYSVDNTMARRHVINVVSASGARVGGRPLSAAEQTIVRGAGGGFTVGYPVSGLHASKGKGGTIVITGRAASKSGVAPRPVSLFTYRLSGTITDTAGKPVQGATVVMRTTDRDFWTFSEPSAADGKYTSLFGAADDGGSDPVQFSVQVAVGRTSYSSGLVPTVKFKRLNSATMNVQLPSSPAGILPLPTETSYPGAIYDGVLVGATAGGHVVKPVAATWPDRTGRFRIVLPATMAGKEIRIFESNFQAFATNPATPGGPVQVSSWPSALSPRVSIGLAAIKLPK